MGRFLRITDPSSSSPMSYSTQNSGRAWLVLPVLEEAPFALGALPGRTCQSPDFRGWASRAVEAFRLFGSGARILGKLVCGPWGRHPSWALQKSDKRSQKSTLKPSLHRALGPGDLAMCCDSGKRHTGAVASGAADTESGRLLSSLKGSHWC